METARWEPPTPSPSRHRDVGREIDDFIRNASSRTAFEVSAVKIARRLNGTLSSNGAEYQINFQRFGFNFTAILLQRLGTQSIRVMTNWPSDQFRLRIFPDGKRKNQHYRGIDDIDVGFRQFDRDFVIQSNDPYATQTILNRKAARHIRKHKKSAHGRIDIDIAGGVANFGGQSTRILKHSQILAIIENFALIYTYLIDGFESATPRTLASSEGIEIKYVEKRKAICMVCGLLVESASVSCVKCKTQHHPDCWKYLGKCSTYACRSRKAI